MTFLILDIHSGLGDNVRVAEIICGVVGALITLPFEKGLFGAKVERLDVSGDGFCDPLAELWVVLECEMVDRGRV